MRQEESSFGRTPEDRAVTEMLGFALIVTLCILGGVAYIGGKIGHRLGAKWAARQIVRVFQREIASKDNDLKSVEERLRQGRFIDLALDRMANELLQAALGEGARQFQAETKPKLDEAPVIMNTKDLQEVVWLADTGLRTWTAEEDVPFRSGDRLSYERAERLVTVLDKFERRIAFSLVDETELEKQGRFDNAENRMVRVWRAYGQS
jgi:hypothetical protein